MTSDESFMKQAVKQAKKAYDKLETPIGCVIVHEDKIIARGYNKRNMKKNTLEKIRDCLKNNTNQVILDDEFMVKAKKPLERMHELAK